MLAIGIQEHRRGGVGFAEVVQSGQNRRALAPVLLMDDHPRARPARRARGVIARAVVNHNDFVHKGPRLFHHRSDPRRFVKSRDEREQLHASVASPNAATCANTRSCSTFHKSWNKYHCSLYWLITPSKSAAMCCITFASES